MLKLIQCIVSLPRIHRLAHKWSIHTGDEVHIYRTEKRQEGWDFVVRHTGFEIAKESPVRLPRFCLARAKWKNSDCVMLCMAFYWQHLGRLLSLLRLQSNSNMPWITPWIGCKMYKIMSLFSSRNSHKKEFLCLGFASTRRWQI